MSINIKLAEADPERVSSCHHMPCRINYRGRSNISQYFSPNIRKQTDSTVTCSFRGHPLQGKDVEIPDGYVGVVLGEKPSMTSDTRTLNMKGSFKKFTLWNWDQIPSSSDKLRRAFDWIEIASSIHDDLLTADIPEDNHMQCSKKLDIED